MVNEMSAPVNTKSFLAFIFNTMEKLDKGVIDTNVACAQAKLMSQANNVLDYELKRTLTQIKLKEMGMLQDKNPVLREIESKGFDNTLNK
jgi:hypothetical protein